MSRYKKTIFFAVLICLMMISSEVMAKSPVGQYFPDSGIITVTGILDGELKDKTVNILAVKNTADITSFTQDDIIYINSTEVNDSGEYSFSFNIGEWYGNSKIYIKSANKYVPVTAFTAETDESITGFYSAGFEPDSNIVTVGSSIGLRAYAFSKEGERISFDSCEFYSDNAEVGEIIDGTFYAYEAGSTMLYANVTVSGKTIASDPVKVEIRNNSDLPGIVAAAFFSEGELLEVTNDISSADKAVFTFDAAVGDITGVRIADLSGSDIKIYEGVWDPGSLTYSVDIPGGLGYGKFKFTVLSDTLLKLSSVIEGTDIDLGIPDTVVFGEEYPIDFKYFNYRGYDCVYDSVEITGDGVSGGVFTAPNEGEYTINAKFYVGGEEKSITKTIKAVGVDRIILTAPDIRMEVDEAQQLSAMVIGNDGSIIDNAVLGFTSSNPQKVRVSENGELTALEIGISTITASCAGVSGSIMIYVGIDGNTDQINAVWFDSKDELEIGETQTLKLLNYYSSGRSETVEGAVFSSDNEDVVWVDENGMVTAKMLGTATVRAEYNNESYIKQIRVVPRLILSCELEIKSKALAVGCYDNVKVFVNHNEYLSPYEYSLYSDDESIIRIENGKIYGVSEGICDIYAKVWGSDGIMYTDKISIIVFEPSGGYLVDELTNADKLFYMDSRLFISPDYGEVITYGINDANAELIYYVSGDINDFIVFDHIAHATYDYEDVLLYVSADNQYYTRITDYTRINGSSLNGWSTDALIVDNVPSGMRYLKIVMNNLSGNTQATRISGVEIGYSTAPEVLDVSIVDDCTDDEIYKNVLGRKAVITFDQPVNPDTLENITVAGQKSLQGYYDAELFRYEAVIPDKSVNEYTISIEGVSDYSGKVNKPFSAAAVPVKDTYKVTGTILYELGDNKTAKRILLENDTLTPKTYTVIQCQYDENDRLISVNKVISGRIDAASEEYVYIDYNNENQKTFIWESFDTLKPLSE